MIKQSIRKALAVTVCSASLLMGSIVLADTTLVLDLQEQLNQQTESYVAHIGTLKQLEGSRQEANKWYEKVRALPETSTDRQYAVANYVREQARLMETMVATVQGLRATSDNVEMTVERLTEVMIDEKKETGEKNLNRLSAEIYDQTLESLMGMNVLIDVMASDPEIANRPGFGTIVNAHQQMMGEFREATDTKENPAFDIVDSLQKMADVFEAQGVLMDIVSDRMKGDFRRLQLLNTQDTAAVMSARINNIMNKLDGLFNGSYGQKARAQTKDLLRRTRPRSFTSTTTYERNIADTGQWLQQMRDRGPAGQ